LDAEGCCTVCGYHIGHMKRARTSRLRWRSQPEVVASDCQKQPPNPPGALVCPWAVPEAE
jgi:hypothetical protein